MSTPAIPAAAELILPAPAKLNLMLHILGRRADGYHELQTLFQFLDFGDELGFALRQDGQIHLHTPIDGVPHDSNLIVRAARLLQQHTGLHPGRRHLARQTPAHGRRHRRRQLGCRHHPARPQAFLATGAAARINSPSWASAWVPTCRYSCAAHAAFAEGVGEKLQPVTLSEPWFLVAIPQVLVSTAEIFSDPELTRDTPPIKVRSLLEGGGRNDCLPVVQKRYPEVRNALILLNKFVPPD